MNTEKMDASRKIAAAGVADRVIGRSGRRSRDGALGFYEANEYFRSNLGRRSWFVWLRLA